MTLTAFKALLHQSLQSLYGIVYGGLSIDVLRFKLMEDVPGSPSTIEVIMRIVPEDQQMILTCLPTISDYQGNHIRVSLLASSSALYCLPACGDNGL